MDERTENTITRIMYMALAAIGAVLLFENIAYPWPVLLLTGLFALSVTLKNAILYELSGKKILGRISLFFDIVLLFAINQLDRSSISIWFYYILAFDAALFLTVRFSALITAICFIVQSSAMFIRSPSFSIGYVTDILINLVIFVIILAAIHSVRYQIGQKLKLSETMRELKIKSRQLENAYLKLKETAEDLEDMTILKERNRIAREIHDTVGHTLTTVLLEMEAGERLIKHDPSRAVEKLKLAKEQVRRGLQDIRESVHTLQTGREIIGFMQSVRLLVDETTRSGDIRMHAQLSEDIPDLSEAQSKMLYRAIQEGFTNGIRHGGSTAFILSLKYDNGFVKLHLSDNGCGTDKVEQGFGLTGMAERVKALGGTLTLSSKQGEGFNIGIAIPIEKGQDKK